MSRFLETNVDAFRFQMLQELYKMRIFYTIFIAEKERGTETENRQRE